MQAVTITKKMYHLKILSLMVDISNRIIDESIQMNDLYKNDMVMTTDH